MTNGYRAGLSGREKAAILLITLGPDLSPQIMKHLREEDIDVLTLEIASTRKVEQEVKDRVLEEFNEMCLAQEYIEEAALNMPRNFLRRLLAASKLRTC